MATVLILGATGMLGHKLCQSLEGHRVFAAVRGSLGRLDDFGEIFSKVSLLGDVDALDEASLGRALEASAPDFVINCIGVIKQLPDASDRRLSVGLNSYLPHRLAAMCSQRNARLIHFSTDCVFSGRQGHYLETDPSDAEDLYGRSKYLGETDAEETSALTLRTSIIGRELSRPTRSFVEWFLGSVGETVSGFRNAIYSGFTTLEMARIVERIITNTPPLSGVHQVASDPISKYDLLLLIRAAFGLEVQVAEETEFRCDRSLVMDSFALATGYEAPSWEAMVEELAADPTDYAALQRYGSRQSKEERLS